MFGIQSQNISYLNNIHQTRAPFSVMDLVFSFGPKLWILIMLDFYISPIIELTYFSHLNPLFLMKTDFSSNVQIKCQQSFTYFSIFPELTLACFIYYFHLQTQFTLFLFQLHHQHHHNSRVSPYFHKNSPYQELLKTKVQ